VDPVTGSALPDPALARAIAVPLRRRVLDLVLEADHAVTVADLTKALGCNHNAVRQHLSQLRAAGLVAETRESRDRPGRPRLLYTATPRPDPYARLARVLLSARRTGQTPRAAGRSAGRAQAAAGLEDTDPFDALEADAACQGFSPRRIGHGRKLGLVLEACPLADIAADDPATVCAIHRGLAEGLVDGIGGAHVEDFLTNDPRRAGCRVNVRRNT
jgi:predicted ArsR family transcriptional regulator